MIKFEVDNGIAKELSLHGSAAEITREMLSLIGAVGAIIYSEAPHPVLGVLSLGEYKDILVDALGKDEFWDIIQKEAEEQEAEESEDEE